MIPTAKIRNVKQQKKEIKLYFDLFSTRQLTIKLREKI